MNPDKATEIIDQALKSVSGRELVSTAEITDLLLDIRLYLIGEESRREMAVGETGTSHHGEDCA